jgi:hypothetical protein
VLDSEGIVSRQFLPDLLRINLNLLEREIQKDLKTRQAAHDCNRREDLTRALAEVTTARAELARCPEGSALAFSVMAAYTLWQSPDVEAARRQSQQTRKGAAETHARAAQLHSAVRSHARALSSNLSTVAKARCLLRAFPTLSIRQLRRIITLKK